MSIERLQPTQESDGGASAPKSEPSEPGLLRIFSGSEPCCTPIALTADPMELGRGHSAFAAAQDPAMSRQHARVAYRDGCFEITDLGSRNGSALDGEPLHGAVTTSAARVLRLGHSLFLLCPDLSPFRQLGVQVHGRRVEGPALRRTVLSIARSAPLSRTLFIGGESGSGKEWLARAFHQAGPQRAGPFVPVNCAALPEALAERLLFGAVKGAYSGATADSEGFVQAASGGTLFLDEVGDLDALVQAKLLRVLESGEVSPLGATRPRKVDLRVCCATCQDLRALVSAGKFRADLYFRVGVPQVSVPPLRRRLEEIPWLIAGVVREAAPDLGVHTSLVEACLLRDWPGNVRELLAGINTAVIDALAAGSATIGAQHLGPTAGTALSSAGSPPAAAPTALAEAAESAPQAARAPDEPPTRAQILAALAQASGNVSAAARELRLQRTQLRRLLERYGIDADRMRGMRKLGSKGPSSPQSLESSGAARWKASGRRTQE